MQYLLNEDEMKDLMEYQLMKQYQQYPIYLKTGTLSLQKRENISTSSQRLSIITAESYSTS
eukprot:696100-Amphidinium_carterae.1